MHFEKGHNKTQNTTKQTQKPINHVIMRIRSFCVSRDCRGVWDSMIARGGGDSGSRYAGACEAC